MDRIVRGRNRLLPCPRPPILIGAPSGKDNRRLWYHVPFRSTWRRGSQPQFSVRHSSMGNGQESKKAGLAGTQGDWRWNSAFRSSRARGPRSQGERPHSSFHIPHSRRPILNQPLTSSRPTRSRVGAWGLIPFTLFLLGCEPRKTSLPHSDPRPETGSSPNTLSPQEVRQGWILLWDGETTFGWEALGEAEWQTGNGILSAASGNSGWLATMGNRRLSSEIGISHGCRRQQWSLSALPQGGGTPRTGYELQICDSHPSYTTAAGQPPQSQTGGHRP